MVFTVRRKIQVRTEVIEKVSIDLMSIPPLIFRAARRRITRTTLAEIDTDITPHHFEIIRLLDEEGTLHPSEIGDRLQIAKAQMTRLINKLVEFDIVERKIDTADRRTHNIALSLKAREMLEWHKQKIVDVVSEIVSRLSDEEINGLSISLRKLRDVLMSSTADNPAK
jgi:DNA-binding MarR family transcriptional regulator